MMSAGVATFSIKQSFGPDKSINPKVRLKKTALSQPLVAPLTREDPNSDTGVGDAPTVVLPRPSDGLDDGGLACRRQLVSQ
jgi:hypothetical protein